MTKIKIIFEEEFNKFEPGERIKYNGDIYTVTGWHPPEYAGDEAVVFFEGWHYGHDAAMCSSVPEEKDDEPN
jgi:hypothetical protein